MNYNSNIKLPFLSVLLLAVFITACKQSPQKASQKYINEVNSWHQKRIHNLKGPEDWLKLAGLFNLEEGTHSFGADSTNDIIFPPNAAPSIGTITKKDTTVSVKIAPGITVTSEGQAVSEIIMKLGNARSGTVLQHKSLHWYLIERRGTYYIRLVDEKHPNMEAFNGIDRFPIDHKWDIRAEFKPFENPKPITVPDILGQGMPDTLYGMLEFTIDDQEYELAPLNHPKKDERFFIIYSDKTNGTSTYSGGKYIYIPTPNDQGITYIDFNKSYNPPCVFTDYATCPLPPAQNRLPVAIPAGEKMYHNAKTY